MSGIAHFIERAGVATTTISLIREQTERVNPPRALWVPFPLGRPLGVAGDAEFQTDVLRAAFDLLATATEPTIADYPTEAPGELGADQWACPLNLSVPPDETLAGRFAAEVASLRPWFDVTTRDRGRTAFGVSGAGLDDLELVVDALTGLAEGSLSPDGESPRAPADGWAFEMSLLIRHLAADIRTFYQDAVAARPGDGAPTHDALNRWIFDQTVLGEVLYAIADRVQESASPQTNFLAFLIIPEGYRRTAG